MKKDRFLLVFKKEAAFLLWAENGGKVMEESEEIAQAQGSTPNRSTVFRRAGSVLRASER